MLKYIIGFYLLFAITGRVFSQTEQVKFEHFSIDNGISQSTIRSLMQDKNGFVWVATQDGLNKYDGYQFTNYYFDPNISGTLSNNFVMDLLEDCDGGIWVGTRRGGLNFFDVATEKFKAYTHLPESKFTISNNQVQTLYEDSQKRLWIGTAHGLNLYNKEKDLFERFFLNAAHKDTPANSVRSILELSKGKLLIGTGGGCYLFDVESGSFEKVNGVEEGVNVLYEGEEKKLWAGTEQGLFLLDRVDKTWEKLALEGDFSITSIAAYSKEWMWLGTAENGLISYHIPSGEKQVYTNRKGKVYSLSHNHIYTIFKDNSGTMWVGTYNGLNKYDEAVHYFKAYFHDPLDDKTLANDNVRGITTDSEGKTWVATRGGGVSVLKGDEVVKKYKRSEGLPDNRAEAVFVDSEGNIWVGLQTGLCLLNPQSGGATFFQSPKSTPLWAENNHVHEIFEDTKGQLWLGTLGGLNKFDKASGSFEVYQDDESDSLGLRGNYVRAIFEDSRGLLWVGTYDGLNQFSFGENGKPSIKHFQHKTWDSNSLSYNYVRTIHEDGDGNIWVGTAGGGLNKLTVSADGRVSQFERFSTKEGLANNSIYGILSDGEGLLWISTNKELAQFNPKKKTFRTYGIKDGLQSNEFNQGAYHKDAKGNMYFGGLSGLSAFHPSQVKENTFAPPIVLTEFRLFGSKVPIGNMDGRKLPVLEKHINQTREILLNYDEDVFTFEFAALNFRHSEHNHYAYKMEGFDERWHNLGSDRTATFTGLPPGEYVFKVKASNNDLVWNEEGKAIQLTISPPFWETAWFRTLVLLLIILLVILVHKLRVQNIKKQKVKLEGLVEVRTKELREEKEKVEAYNKEVLIKNKEISEQKEELEHRNIKIMDSLRYAETIQKAILPEDYKIRKAFDEFFVLYRPKDIVSGDFYWFSKVDTTDEQGNRKEVSISAVIDCTGHGVPGAFMSLIGNAILNEIVNENKVTDGKQILDMLNKKIYKSLKQEDELNTDGMDMCLVTIEKKDENESLIKFSGAKRPLFIYQKATEKITVLPGARKSIGGKQRHNKFYVNEDFVIKKGDILYLTTDGLVDQNNRTGDKLGRVRLLKYLQKIATSPLETQKEELEELIERYQKNVEQRDDITVMGIKV
ncbi:two-component regulator propeller domain-containing protein [Flammeovirgaceae bacterium SG7u.111]|nr:two-component regulator propeller domain-containing protein [Flammeovirgaceae bacterium SG7u.132]WPO36330.1 two-component regulator propeller domain-containing protein [Flammeovirgaceae bacterium SG7u.111]